MKRPSAAAEAAQQRYPQGLLIRGTVIDHQQFGIFADIGDPTAVGLVLIVNFVDTGRMTPDEFPAIGTDIEAFALGWQDTRWKQYPGEVVLSVRPSDLCKSESEKSPDSK